MEEMGQLLRTKWFAMEPMSVEDAMLQMEMLDHSFFLFLNMDSFENNVADRRQDEDYGLGPSSLVPSRITGCSSRGSVW